MQLSQMHPWIPTLPYGPKSTIRWESELELDRTAGAKHGRMGLL